jgi:hypothetical protein
LAALAIAQSIVFSGTTATSFFGDFAVHARYLIAMPALIVAEADCIPKLERIVRNFVDAGLIADSDMVRYQYAVASTHRILDSRYGDLVAPVIAYVIIVATRFYVSPDLFPDWQRAGHSYYSLAGWWHVLISLPLLLILFFGWLWRLALWARFLFLMASLNLQLIPSHPDHVGGLKFVSSSLRGFRLISLGLGAVVAGAIANRVVYHGAGLLSFKDLALGLSVFTVLLFAGPLTVFVRRLRQTKKRGVFEYGALANRLGREFEAKWLSTPAEAGMLEAPDFSATTDLYSVSANVYEMRDIPFSWKDLVGPILPALLPIGAVALLAIPLQVVIDSLFKLLV